MRRTLLILLSFLSCVAWGQTYRYRYWIDNNIGSVVSGSATGEKQLSVSLSSLSNGLHAIHVQVRNSSSVWSSVRTRYFIKEKSASATARYWIDNDLNTLHNGVTTNGIIDLDISKLDVGLHVVHYQTFNAKGDASPVRTKHFFVDQVQIGTLTANIAIDDGEATNYALSEDDIEIDISELADGRHELNVMLMDGNGCLIGQQVNEFIVGDARDMQTLELMEIPEMTYGAEAYSLPQTTVEGLDLTWSVDGDAVASVNENVLTIVGAGTATITAAQEGNDDYQPFSREFTLTVNKAMLTITANDCTKQEGDANPELTVSYSGFVYEDNAASLTTPPAVSTTATTDSPVGTYPITVSGAASDNYEFTYVSGTLTVMEKPTIIEVTDISQMANVIYIEPTEERTGTEATISFKMKNTAAIRGFQFDLVLPEGVTPVEEDGEYVYWLNVDRAPKKAGGQYYHTLDVTEQPDGSYRFLCGAQQNKTFMGNDGEIAVLKVNIAEDMQEGDHFVILRNIKLTETDISNYYQTDEVVSKLTIVNYIPGDISNDGIVDVSDYIGVANHILGNTPAGFNARAADVNKDNAIDVSDYIGIANIILTGSIYGQNVSASRSKVRGVNTDVSTIDNVIYIEPLSVEPNGRLNLSLKMKNSAAIRGFQFDLELPEGVTPVEEDGEYVYWLNVDRAPKKAGGQYYHTLEVTRQADGTYRFLCGAQQDKTFLGNDGEVAVIQVDVAADMAVGDYPIILKYVKLTESDISHFYLTDELVSTLTVIGNTMPGDANGDGKVDIADVTAIINYINGNVSSNFNEVNADVNGDGKIDIADVTGIINIINS